MTELPTIRVDRLLKLAEHLENPSKLIHKTFNFNVVNEFDNETGDVITFFSEFDNKRAKTEPTYGCGTSGCALGECPAVFKEWHFKKHKDSGYTVIEPTITALPTKEGDNRIRSFRSADAFFGLLSSESFHLFAPTEGNSHRYYGGKKLKGTATSRDVAKQIRAFVKKWQTNPWNREEVNDLICL